MSQEADIPLDIEIEGGIDSPLGGKIVVADIYRDGLADRNGKSVFWILKLCLSSIVILFLHKNICWG